MIDRPTDEERIRLDFMPFVERTVQAYGIVIDGVHYYSDVLRRFIGATEGGRRRSFIFRRDPRDISAVYFWDSELQRYSAIPYRNTTHPPISIWELREIRRKLRRRDAPRTTRRRSLKRTSGCANGRLARSVKPSEPAERASAARRQHRSRRPSPPRLRPSRLRRPLAWRTSRRSKLRSHDARGADRQNPRRSLDPLCARRSDRGEPMLLRRWTMGEDYLRLLASFEVALPLEHRSGLTEPALALKILSLSEGTIGEISTLLCRAALEAIEQGTEKISSASLDRCGYVAPSERRRAAVRA